MNCFSKSFFFVFLFLSSIRCEVVGKYVTTTSVKVGGCLIHKGVVLNIESTVDDDGHILGVCKYDKSEIRIPMEYLCKMTLVGKTRKGFDIYDADGLTYINDLLIVNRTYSVPRDYSPTKPDIESHIREAFNKMKVDAQKKNLNIYITSGYRSYDYQKKLFERYLKKDKDPKIVESYCGRPGHSEHQTGLCFDLRTEKGMTTFGNTKEGKWVAKNCWKYGFIMRYPYGKRKFTGAIYEPWHFRYVGKELAKYLYENKLTIEEYFGITSVYNS